MKFTILKNNLKEGLKIIEGACLDNSNLLILKNFLIESFENKIKLSATNLELAITNFISGKIIENGSLSIPFNIFNSIINNLLDEKINLEINNNKLIIKTDNYQAEIQGVKKEDFPIIPKIENIKFNIEIQNIILKDALISIINSIINSENKPELNGVLFDYQTTLIKLTTTDTFRLSEKTIINTQFKSNIEKNFKIIIPLKTINEVIKALQNNEDEKTIIYLDTNQIMFKIGNIEIISRLINGEFPEYQQIIPKEFDIELFLNKEQLINAVKLSSVFTDKFNEIKFILKEGEKNLEISSFSQALGENKYLIPVKIKNTKQEQFETVFNWRFVLDGIKNIKSEDIYLGLNNSSRPAIIKSPEDNSWFYILMPIKS